MNVQLVQIRSRSLRLIAFCGHMFVVPSETLYLSVPQSLLWVACDQVDFTSSRFFLGWKLELAPTPKLGTMHCVSASFFVVAFPIEPFLFYRTFSCHIEVWKDKTGGFSERSFTRTVYSTLQGRWLIWASAMLGQHWILLVCWREWREEGRYHGAVRTTELLKSQV